MDAWAICSRDPVTGDLSPKTDYIYPLDMRDVAGIDHRKIWRGDLETHPICKVRIEIVEDEAPVLRPDQLTMEAVAAIATPGRK